MTKNIAVLSAVLASLALAAPAGASVIHPTTTQDVLDNADGHCSLREAVASADTNLASGLVGGECPAGEANSPDTITLGAATYELTRNNAPSGPESNDNDDLNLHSSVNFIGQGAAATHIAIADGDRGLEVTTDGSSPSVVQVTVDGVTISGGTSPAAEFVGGGGISMQTGELTLRHCGFDGNRTLAANGTPGAHDGGRSGAGGALAFSGTALMIDDCTFTDNHTGDGGAGYTGGGTGGNGGDSGDGGAIWLHAPDAPTIRNSVFSGNSTGAGGVGGGGTSGNNGGNGGTAGDGGVVFTNAAFQGTHITDTSFSGNAAGPGGAGGSSSATGGKGGSGGNGGNAGVAYWIGSTTLTRVRMLSNSAGDGGAGGASANTSSSAGSGGSAGAYYGVAFGLVAIDSTFSGNTAGDGATGRSSTTPPGSAAGTNGGDGGAFVLHNSPVAFERTTISGNSAGRGGDGADDGTPGAGGNGGGLLIGNFGSANTLLNTTISSNSAGQGGTRVGLTSLPGGAGGHGSGIRVNSPASLTATYVTLAGNLPGKNGAITSNSTPASGGTAGAISITPGGFNGTGSAAFTSSILASNGPFACEATQLSASPNDTIAYEPVSDNCPGLDADPQLEPLADNGGPTQTRTLAAGSPALDIGVAAGCPGTDQRGLARPQGPGCDAGAFERAVAAPVTPGPSGDNPPGGGGGGDTPPPGPPADTTKPKLELALKHLGLARALAKGFGANFTTDEPGTAVVELFVSGDEAKGLKKVRTVRVARGSKQLTRAGKQKVVAKFTSRSRKEFRKRKRLTVLVRVTVKDSAGNKAVTKQRLKLKR